MAVRFEEECSSPKYTAYGIFRKANAGRKKNGMVQTAQLLIHPRKCLSSFQMLSAWMVGLNTRFSATLRDKSMKWV
jgi:hypothetical protein